MEKLLKIIGGRKFFMTMGCGVVCTGLVIFKCISDGVFCTIILGTVGAYITGNVVEAKKNAAKTD